MSNAPWSNLFSACGRRLNLLTFLLCEASVYRCAVPEDWWLSHLDYWDWDSESALKALDALHETDHLYGLCHRTKPTKTIYA